MVLNVNSYRCKIIMDFSFCIGLCFLLGAGNTWGRLLIEYATGIYSGSVYNDISLLDTLPGEFTCNKSVSVIKVHPHTHSFQELNSGDFVNDDDKCIKGKCTKFNRAVLLIRDPYDSIWSEYQRLFSRSHVKGIDKLGFDWSRWHANAADLSHSYHKMLRNDYAGVEKTYGAKNVLYIRYELLKDKTTRIEELKKVTTFLNRPASNERLQCAFILAKNDKAKRVLSNTEMTKVYAYTQPITCRMWALFGKGAKRLNYEIFRNMSCVKPDGGKYEPIPHVYVRPFGNYQGPKIDFGGHKEFDNMMLKQNMHSKLQLDLPPPSQLEIKKRQQKQLLLKLKTN